jgi:gluconolactonase
MEFRVLASELGATEGPVVRADGTIVVTSLTDRRIYGVSPDGTVRTLAETDTSPNGATEGPGGVYLAQSGMNYTLLPNGRVVPGPRPRNATGGVQVLDPASGRIDWITTDPVSPNDLCFGPDGLLYVTDPTRKGWEDGRLWRIDVHTGESELLSSVPWYPNGIGFGLDDDVVFVASSGDSRIYRIGVDSCGMGRPEVAVQLADGRPDGFAFDLEGNIVIAVPFGHPGIQVWSPEGKMVDGFEPVCGRGRNVALDEMGNLYICDDTGLYAVEGWGNVGMPLHPFRHEVLSRHVEPAS